MMKLFSSRKIVELDKRCWQVKSKRVKLGLRQLLELTRCHEVGVDRKRK